MSKKSIEQLYQQLLDNSQKLMALRFDAQFAKDAYHLMKNNPNKEFWDNNPVPTPPLEHKAKFETLRASLTFLLPIAIVSSAVAVRPDALSLAIATPLALLAGVLNHKGYKKAVSRAKEFIEITDCRYAFFKKYEDEFRVYPHQFTYDIVAAKAKDYENYPELFESRLLDDKQLGLKAAALIPDHEDRVRLQKYLEEKNSRKKSYRRNRHGNNTSQRGSGSENFPSFSPQANVDGMPMSMGLPYGVTLNSVTGFQPNSGGNVGSNSSGGMF